MPGHPHPIAFLLTCLAAAGIGPRAAAKHPAIIQPGERVVFLGDSNTFAGGYVTRIEAVMRLHRDFANVEVLNLGLPSETCSGLSEPDHPFPRPDVHERLSRVLKLASPDVVFASYGMNDGIYYPFDESRFRAFQDGINRLITAVHESGARIVVLTPPPFDPLPMRAKGGLRPAGTEKFSWTAIYEDYDDVMRRYSEWILQQGDRADAVIDVRTPILQYVEQRRRDEPDYAMSTDGVHIDSVGHAELARAVLQNIAGQAPQSFDDLLVQRLGEQQNIRKLAWLSHTGHKRPGIAAGLPLDEARVAAARLDAPIAARVKQIESEK